MIAKRRICIAEDHTILRSGLRAILQQEPEFEIVGEASDGIDLLRIVQELHPDVILMDLSMPRMNGLEAMQEIKARQPDANILILTMHAEEEYVIAALDAGARGYLLKDATQAELILALKTVLAGKTYLSPDISMKILQGYLDGKKTARPAARWQQLTRREREVLKLVAEGYKNKHIAELLHMSIKTVDTHRSNLMKKLGVHNAAALTVHALEYGLVEKSSILPPTLDLCLSSA
jgi:two-component system, NarL family, response regulator NreC